MGYEVEVLLDSVSVPLGHRITTFRLRYPKFIHSEFMTHRVFSRNARSSRAVPVSRMIDEIQNDLVVPACWGTPGKGMQAGSELSEVERDDAIVHWKYAAIWARTEARELSTRTHKQIANRVLEPFAWIDVVCTSTEYLNFFALRCDAGAQPEMQKLAVMMARAYRDSVPTPLAARDWHLPYVTADELDGWDTGLLLKLSAARCARVSYKPFDADAADAVADLALADRLYESGHWSPFEHQAQASDYDPCWSGNFRGWIQHRQMLMRNVHKNFDFGILDTVYKDRDYVLPAA